MKFQHKLLAMALLMSGVVFTEAQVGASKPIFQLSAKEIGALKIANLSEEQEVELLYVALFSGLPHNRTAAQSVFKQQDKNADFGDLKNRLLSAGLEPLIEKIQNAQEREKIKKAYIEALFHGWQPTKLKARKLIADYTQKRGLAPVDWQKLRKQVLDTGLGGLLSQAQEEATQDETAPEKPAHVKQTDTASVKPKRLPVIDRPARGGQKGGQVLQPTESEGAPLNLMDEEVPY